MSQTTEAARPNRSYILLYREGGDLQLLRFVPDEELEEKLRQALAAYRRGAVRQFFIGPDDRAVPTFLREAVPT